MTALLYGWVHILVKLRGDVKNFHPQNAHKILTPYISISYISYFKEGAAPRSYASMMAATTPPPTGPWWKTRPAET